MLPAVFHRPWTKTVLTAVENLRALAGAHTVLIITGLINAPSSSAHLITAYARLGNLSTASQVFDQIPQPAVSVWNSLLAAYSRARSPESVLVLYRRMVLENSAKPDSTSFTLAIKASAHLMDLKSGENVWNHANDLGYGSDVFVCSSLLNLYAKCGKMDDALKVFKIMPTRDIVSWTTVINGFVSAGRAIDAMKVYKRMLLEGMVGDEIVMVGLIQACALMGDERTGRSIHGYMVRSHMQIDVLGNSSLIDMYAKNGSLERARSVFDKMQYKNVVSWSSFISGYAQNGLAEDALLMLVEMQEEGLEPDQVALVCSLLACWQIGFLKLGKSIHGYIVRKHELDQVSGTAVIDMYSKCGNLSNARALFDRISSRDLISWNMIIASYGAHGDGKEALALFLQMIETGLKPDHATFAALLSAFSHSGLLEEGRYWFECMSREFGIEPLEKHYACMVDLLARAGQFEEAENFISSMEMKPGIAVWVALLSGCHIHRKYEIGEQVVTKILELNPDDNGIYSLVSNVNAAAKNWEKVAGIRKKMKNTGLRKIPGYSLVEVECKLYAFLMEDKSHPQHDKIMRVLKRLDLEMRKLGCDPKMEPVCHDLEEELKGENVLQQL